MSIGRVSNHNLEKVQQENKNFPLDLLTGNTSTGPHNTTYKRRTNPQVIVRSLNSVTPLQEELNMSLSAVPGHCPRLKETSGSAGSARSGEQDRT